MCGIAGLTLRDPALEPFLGAMLAGMLSALSERGPDSAGIAIYDHDEKLAVTKDVGDAGVGACGPHATLGPAQPGRGGDRDRGAW